MCFLDLTCYNLVMYIYAAMAAQFCKEVGGKRLILTHFSQRYRREEEEGPGEPGEPGEERVGKLLAEAEGALIGTGITVNTADDFKTFLIPAKKI